MNALRRFSGLSSAILILVFVAPLAVAQVSVNVVNAPLPTQTFNSLPASGSTTWTNNTTIAGWYHARTGTGTTIVANDGSSNAGNLYSYGTGTNVDRALGSVGSGNAAIGNLFWGVRLLNNSGATITSIDVVYTGEQWRNSAAAAQTITFSYLVGSPTVTGSLAEFQSAGVAVPAGDFTSPITGGAAGALVGNNAANQTVKTFTIGGLSIPNGTEIMLRWSDPDHTGADHGLSIDDITITPNGAVVNAAIVPNCPTPVTTFNGTATTQGVSASDTDGTVVSANITGITPSDPGTITLTGFTPAGGVGGTANATLNVGATTPVGTYSVTIQWANNDGTPQTADCVVTVQVDPAPVVTFIHNVQGSGAASGMIGATVTVEGIVTGDFQPIPNDNRLSGFFLQEEDADATAENNPATSEGIFVFCSACPTNVAEGQRVMVTGTVSEFFNSTQITATTAGAVVITDAGNNLAQITPATINLPVVGVIDDFYEPMESMVVTYSDTLTVSEYFEQFRYGRLELFEGERPRQFTEANAPNVAGYAAHLDNLNRRRVILDDDDNVENSVLNLPNGSQFVFHPQANGGLSAIGTHGTDFFRGGDTVSSLTGILHYSFSGGATPDEWRVRPVAAAPAAFTPVNTRPPTPPAVGGAIQAASVNVLNYFTTLNVRGADSVAELNRQRERTSIVLCGLDADVAALMEIENHPTNVTINDLLADVNTRCGGANPYTFVNTGGALGTDQIRVLLIYRTNVLAPVGAPQVDLDAVHNRPPTAQTFDVVDAGNPAFGQRFTVLANHSKSKGCGGAAGADLDQNDGQSCFAATRVAQANRILTWVNGTVIPAAGDPDVLLLGDFNSYAQETATTTITNGGYTDLEAAFLGPNAYSYLFDGQLGHIDYIFSSASITPQITGVAPWHINADENPLFDYNDEIDDGAAEQFFEEKPDGSALAPPRVMFAPASPFRASDHDPVLAGIFAISDLAITKTDSPDPVNAGNNITYTITVTNNGPDAAPNASWTDNLTDSTFVSLSSVAGWSCTTPAVGATGMITCTNPSFGVGNAVFTLTTNVSAFTAAGTILSNTANVTSNSTEGNPGDEGDTETTTVATAADLSVTKADSPDPVTAGNNITYTITVNNAGPSAASTVALNDSVPTNTTFVSLASPGGWACTTPAVGATGNISCTNASAGVGNHVFTLVVNVDASTASGSIINNSASVTSTNESNSGNETGNAATTVATAADLSVTKSDSPDPVNAGSNITYTITVNNAGPSNASTVELTDTIPTNTTFVSLANPGGWSCTTPAVGGTGNISCTIGSLGLGNAVFTLVVNVDPSTASGATINNSATVTSTNESSSGNETGNAATTVATAADLSVTKADSPDPVNAGANITYTITVNNAGPSNASTVELTDTIPTGTTFVSLASPGGWSCTTPAVGGTGNISCTNPSLGLGNAVFTLVVAVPPSTAAGASISNSATVTSANESNSGNETGNSETTVATSADLSVTKVDTPDPVNAGANVTYTITVNNAGPSNASTVTLTDVMTADMEFVSLGSAAGWSCTTPPSNATGTISCSAATVGLGNHVFTLVVRIKPATASGAVINNSATVATSVTPDPNSGNETGSAATTVTTSADLQVTKSDSPDPVNAGSNITYSILVTNAGPSDAAAATLMDTIPAGTTYVSGTFPGSFNCTTPAVGGTGTVSCTHVSSMIAGASAPFTIVVAVDPSTAAGTVISNDVTVSTTTPDPNSGNDTANATTTVATSADLAVTKVDTPDPVTAGTNLTYTITIDNSGPSTALTPTLADTIPTGTTFVSFTAPAGWSCTTPAVGGTGNINCSAASQLPGNAVFTLVVAVDAGIADGTIITNTATAASPTDSNATNNDGVATTTVGTGSADLSITKTDSPDPVVPGNNITYTITVTNAGPSNATTATMDDTIPANTTFVSLAAPAGWTCTTPAVGGTGNVSCSNPTMAAGSAIFTLVVNTDPANTTAISNTATAGSATTDPNPGNESDTETTAIAAASSDLSVAKTDSPDPVIAGNNVTYTITVNNAGPSAASTVTLTDVLPAEERFVSIAAPAGWLCTTPAVLSNGTVTCSAATVGLGNHVFTLVVQVAADTANGTVISNSATVASATADPNSGNQTGTALTTVTTSADLAVTKTDSPDPINAGSNLSYTITLNNAGPSNAATVTLADTIPTDTTFVSLSAPAGWTCLTPAVGGTGAISCTNPSVDLGNDVFTLVVNVDADATAGTIITNTATATSATADPNAANDSDTETTTVATGSADLSVTKTDTPDPVAPSANITYTITVNNAGPNNATTASLTDAIPANTTFVSLASAAGWTCLTPAVGGTGNVTCTNPSMAVGNAVFTLVVNVNGGTANATVITNTATADSATPDPNAANDSDTETTTVVAATPPLVSGTKTAAGTFAAGSIVTYTIVLTNSGGTAQGDNPGNELTDVLPSQLTLISANATSGTAVATVATNTVTWNGSIAAGGTVTITIQALIELDVPPGTSITNQATISFDSDGNGTNDASAVTDDPGQGGSGNPTPFVVGAPTGIGQVPALDGFGLAFLAALLAALGLIVVRRS